mmetsp:Transcript_4007/g.7028  ORF Transcript_4007/g.7028 Transcript_4007/m.7028 type:complete len:243 (+) Transcript_4007:136-864(+)
MQEHCCSVDFSFQEFDVFKGSMNAIGQRRRVAEDGMRESVILYEKQIWKRGLFGQNYRCIFRASLNGTNRSRDQMVGEDVVLGSKGRSTWRKNGVIPKKDRLCPERRAEMREDRWISLDKKADLTAHACEGKKLTNDGMFKMTFYILNGCTFQQGWKKCKGQYNCLVLNYWRGKGRYSNNRMQQSGRETKQLQCSLAAIAVFRDAFETADESSIEMTSLLGPSNFLRAGPEFFMACWKGGRK